jgi:hypothetical protein
MQYSQQPNFPSLFPSFKRHRSSIDQAKFKIDLRLPALPPLPVWASLPTPPMSGSPTSDKPSSPRQIAGQRRKRSDSPPPVTTASSSLPAILHPDPSATGPYAPPLGERPLYGPLQPPSYTTPYTPARMLAYSGGSVAIAAPSPTETRFPPSQISPRTTRKNKAHVASACINCKKKHLRCDNARPCHRCVQSGKEVRMSFEPNSVLYIKLIWIPGHLYGCSAQEARATTSTARRPQQQKIFRCKNIDGSSTSHANHRSSQLRAVWTVRKVISATTSTAASFRAIKILPISTWTIVRSLCCALGWAEFCYCNGPICTLQGLRTTFVICAASLSLHVRRRSSNATTGSLSIWLWISAPGPPKSTSLSVLPCTNIP